MNTCFYYGSIVILLCCMIATGTAASVDAGYIKIQPTGDLEAGTPVTADFTINFYDTFPIDQEISMTTDLEDPVWKADILIDGVKNPQPSASGETFTITGWLLEYPQSEVQVVVSLSGKTPSVKKSENKMLVGIYVVNTSGRVLDTVKEVTAFVVNTAEIVGEVSDLQSKVQDLNRAVSEYKSLGIDTSKAEDQLNQALDSIKKAESASYSNAKILMTNAQTFFDNGMIHLDYSYADKYINDAKNNIEEADSIIDYLKTEKRMASDPRLAPIITTREFAAEYAQNAMDLYNKGLSSDAKLKSTEAYEKSKILLNETINLRDEIESAGIGVDFSGVLSLLPYVIGVIIIVLVVVGILIWNQNRGGGGKGRKPPGPYGKSKKKAKSGKSRYDELF